MKIDKKIEKFVDGLTKVERKDLYESLIKRERDNARSMAIVMASALEANLKFLGKDTDYVRAIITDLTSER